MSDAKPPPAKAAINTTLASRTAEMLALPHMVCRRRDCRRRNACWWHFNANSEPCCLRNLTAEQRRLFDQVYDRAHAARSHLGWCGLTFTSDRPWWRSVEDAGVEIARNVVGKWDRKRWNAARREREKMPPAEG